MSSKTKIVVLKSRELIYTGIFIVLGIMLILLLFYMFSPDKDKSADSQKNTSNLGVKSTHSPEDNPMQQENPNKSVETFSNYIPGVYTTDLNLGGSSLLMTVTVDATRVTGISIDNMDESLSAMYPLVQPSIDEINSQIGKVSSVDDITYSSDNKYTTILILQALDDALEDAKK